MELRDGDTPGLEAFKRAATAAANGIAISGGVAQVEAEKLPGRKVVTAALRRVADYMDDHPELPAPVVVNITARATGPDSDTRIRRVLQFAENFGLEVGTGEGYAVASLKVATVPTDGIDVVYSLVGHRETLRF